MKGSPRRVSRIHHIVCPRCGIGEIEPRGSAGPVCGFCGRTVEREVLRCLIEIASLPETLGRHACECGHPEMRRLPDGVFHCPACGSEVLPTETSPASAGEQGQAWHYGWEDGCSGEPAGAARSERLARWEDPRDRLDYYRGRRAGEEECGRTTKPPRSL
ncbi:MAG: hypothetical protein AB1425_10290 [Actinomycetota bacterium]